MIEKIVLDFLSERLLYPVHMGVPAKAPSRFYVLRKVDSSRENYVDTAMFTILSYAESSLEAAKANELAKSAMDDLTELDCISASKRNGDYQFPDPKTKQNRYQAVYSVTY